MDNNKTKKKRTVGDFIRTIIIIIALAVFCYSGYQLLTIYLEYKKGSDEYNNLAEQYSSPEQGSLAIEEIDGVKVMENPIDFDGLLALNDELIGWLQVDAEGIDVNYPIMQAKDNDYYLHRTFEKTYNFAGCIFLDHLSKKTFTDRNSLVYGHNMKNGSMFGTLKKFKNEGVYESSPYFWIYTPDKIFQYEIFACQEVLNESKTYQLTFKDDKDFLDYVKAAKDNSYVKNNVEVSKDDKIVTLSTCTGNDATRFVVQGKLIETYQSK